MEFSKQFPAIRRNCLVPRLRQSCDKAKPQRARERQVDDAKGASAPLPPPTRDRSACALAAAARARARARESREAGPGVAMAAVEGRGGEGALWGSRGPGRPAMEDELYLENIDEFVTDQNRVVTYKWLSFTLGVHVNQAKQMLYDYIERKRKENAGAQLHVTYLLAGNVVQNGHTYHKVAVVKEDKLEAMKAKLSTVASVHVYSIQKALLRDSSPLFNTDYDILKTNLQNCSRFSAICCAAAVPRPVAEDSQAKTPTQGPPQPPPTTKGPDAPVLNGQAPGTSSKQPAQPAKGILGMFAAKPAPRPKNGHKEAHLDAKESPGASMNNSKAPAKGNTLNNFFGKAAVSKEGAGKARAEPEQQKEERSAAKPAIPSTDPKSPPGHEKPSKEAEPARGQQREKRRAQRTDMEEEEEEEKGAGHMKKKRRRIKLPQSDSSSDGEGAASSPAASEDSPPEPAQKPQPPPAPTPVVASVREKKRKRKRVLKSRTFVDDEGCIVTEKAYESESCTESEEDLCTKPGAARKAPVAAAKKEPKEEKRGTKKGGLVPAKPNKQASIMGFFQKK
ncbi:DNA polymerase delta subunit 3 [Crotalus adamanteus]|uniref:DNA polymerase delta subunit 3 n=1 Tax=Crotalus adamanteus TaxID=8729 RepID=A0AAW1BLB3_CROAD